MQCTSNAQWLEREKIIRRKVRSSLWALAAGLLGILFLGGCESSNPNAATAPMPTGEPEVTIQGKTADQIKAEARKFFAGRGYQERSTDHPSKLAFDRPEGKSEPGRSPETAVRVRLTLHPLSNGACRVTGYSYRVLRWRQYLEEECAIIAALPQIQALLNQIKANLDASR